MAAGLVLIWHFSALIDHSKDLTLQTSFTQSHMHPDKHFNLIFTRTTQMQCRVILLNYHSEMT